MHRRSLLARGLVTLPVVAGCLSAPVRRNTPTGRRQLELVAVDDPAAIPVRPSVEVVRPRATQDAPPSLRVTVTNTASYPVEVGEERAIVFAFVHSRERPGVVLLPVDDEYAPVRRGCWRLAEPIAIPEYYGIVRLAPGNAVTREVGVWGGPDLAGGCLPTGRFRFTTTYSVARDETDGPDEPDHDVQWGFELSLA